MIKDIKLESEITELCHYTDSNALKYILEPEYISLRAKRVDGFWAKKEGQINQSQSEQTDIDKYDTQEFHGVYGVLKNLIKRQNKRSYHPKDELYDKLSNLGVKEVLGSTNTPYIVCFSEKISNEKLFEEFGPKNEKDNYPISFIFDTSLLNANNDSISKFHREELLRIWYTKSDPEDVSKTHAEVLKNFNDAKKRSASKKDLENQTDFDDLIDMCFYIKREQYKHEEEYRYILRKEQKFAFGLDNNNNPRIIVENIDDNKTNYIDVKFPPKCLKGFIFGRGVNRAAAEAFLNNDNKAIKKLIEENYSHIYVRLFDGTEIIPPNRKDKNNPSNN